MNDSAADAFLADLSPQCVGANPALLRLMQARRVLLLQGPVGPFFDRLADWLKQRGTDVARVAFNGGDLRDCRSVQPVVFDKGPAQWPHFLEQLLHLWEPDTIVLFGQCRSHHRVARELAGRRRLALIVTEEGYFRPGHLTMELDGVNGLSTTLNRFFWDPAAVPSVSLPPAGRETWLWQKMALHACAHYLALWRGRKAFPDYEHHRETSVLNYSSYWIGSLAKKYLRALPDHLTTSNLSASSYFFVPLQLESDSQITQHSRFPGIADFVVEVMHSFARHASDHMQLVFKQHPHSRGGPGHAALIRATARELRIAGRVVHLVEGHTPTLVENALGVVVINSTVGLQALARRRPLKVMGEALYNQPGLTFQGDLDSFWFERPAPRARIVAGFLEQLRNLTQVPCHVYGLRDTPLPWPVEPSRRRRGTAAAVPKDPR
ncbi:capsular biosynthesis protein [Ramlibacter rhizophilus]|uniref:capsular biosynthesis protein n=1 Tax=Ramlibacter rhizophilus TaxID=1781167 RepID=UPI0014325D96|nr:capsular biosynthesis protein [Ramlibacter rhizophilus]